MKFLVELFAKKKISNKYEQGFLGILLIISIITCAGNLFSIIRKYAVNLIFWDQIDFMYPIFTNSNIWTLFSWQHGPHRQGLGELIIWLSVNCSRWNSRIDSYIIGFILLICTFLALGIKYYYIGRLQWVDIIIPFIIMTQQQWEQLVTGPNISHSVLPLFLILVISASFIISNQMVKVIIQLCVTFVCTFTGFGFFAGSILFVIYFIETIYYFNHRLFAKSIRSFIAVFGIVCIYGAFFVNYILNPAVDCFEISWKNILQYPIFMSWMMAKFLGIQSLGITQFSVILGGGFTIGMLLISVHFAKNIFSEIEKPEFRLNQTIFFLIAFSLEFMLFTAIGRICLGIQAGLSSRYMTLLIPGIFAISLWLGARELSPKVGISIFFLAVFLLVRPALTYSKNDYLFVTNYAKAKIKWRTCYVINQDIDYCNEATNFSIYPTVSDRLIYELEYLKEHQYNLFRSK
jgi:hypothetical protein